MTEVNGRLETIKGRVAEGWVSAGPEPVLVEIRDRGILLGSTMAAVAPGAAADAGRRFSFLLPYEPTGVDAVTARLAGAAADLHGPEANPEPAGLVPHGSFDMITDEGWALGWAWYPDAPAARVEIEFIIDGEVAGTTVAESHRGDVAAAGMGDGNYGFSWALPYQVFLRPRATEIAARDKRSGQFIPEPRVFKQRVVADALEKVAALEAELAQVRATMALLADQSRAEDRAATDLFRTVGDFFINLAAATAAGEPPGSLKPLKAAVTEVTNRYPRLTFSPQAAPLLTVCVDAAAPLEVTYRNLRAARDTASDAAAVFLVLDGGEALEAPLLPAVLRNVAYLRMHDRGAAARLNEVARHAPSDILVFIGPNLEPSAGWAEAVRAGFAAAPAPAILAARITGADGELQSAGMSVGEGALFPRAGAEAGDATQASEVAAASAAAFALRRDVWLAIGGLDEAYAAAGPALAAFCARAAAGGHHIAYAPDFHLVHAGPVFRPADLMARDDAARLRHDLAALKQPAQEEVPLVTE